MATQSATTRRHGRAKAYAAANPATAESMQAADERETVTPAFLDPVTRNEMVARAA